MSLPPSLVVHKEVQGGWGWGDDADIKEDFFLHQRPKQSSQLLRSLSPPGCCPCTVARAGRS